MEYQKITNLLGTTSDNVPRFFTKKWLEFHDHSGNTEDRCKPRKQIRFKTTMLRSDPCDFSDAYVVVQRTITLTKDANREFIRGRNRSLAFKNNAPFFNSISKINNVLIYNADDLDVVMPMYNLIEYNKSHRKTTGSLWNDYRNESNNPPATDYNADSITNYASFKYKRSIIGKT